MWHSKFSKLLRRAFANSSDNDKSPASFLLVLSCYAFSRQPSFPIFPLIKRLTWSFSGRRHLKSFSIWKGYFPIFYNCISLPFIVHGPPSISSIYVHLRTLRSSTINAFTFNLKQKLSPRLLDLYRAGSRTLVFWQRGMSTYIIMQKVSFLSFNTFCRVDCSRDFLFSPSELFGRTRVLHSREYVYVHACFILARACFILAFLALRALRSRACFTLARACLRARVFYTRERMFYTRESIFHVCTCFSRNTPVDVYAHLTAGGGAAADDAVQHKKCFFSSMSTSSLYFLCFS